MARGPPCPALPYRASPAGSLAGFTSLRDRAAGGISGSLIVKQSPCNSGHHHPTPSLPPARARAVVRVPSAPHPDSRCLACLPRQASLFLLCSDLERKQRGPQHRGPRVVFSQPGSPFWNGGAFVLLPERVSALGSSSAPPGKVESGWTPQSCFFLFLSLSSLSLFFPPRCSLSLEHRQSNRAHQLPCREMVVNGVCGVSSSGSCSEPRLQISLCGFTALSAAIGISFSVFMHVCCFGQL